jgi:hypothetical protein
LANPTHLRIVRDGAAAVAKWRRRNPGATFDLRRANLHHVDLRGSNLTGADLRRANLTWTGLRGAELGGAELGGADMTFADLEEVDLSRADLNGADLSFADLLMADLSEADLSGASLTSSRLYATFLDGAKFPAALFGTTTFARCNLGIAVDLSAARHTAPSSVGVDTLVQTLDGAGGVFTRDHLTFFEAAGVPRTLLDYLPSLLETHPIEFFSCFISYGAGDDRLAHTLYLDLKDRGVRCYKYDADAVIGRGVWANIDRAISLHEKVVVICSKSSLHRPGVLREIERALQKEDRLQLEAKEHPERDLDTDVLVPITLDDYLLYGWAQDRAAHKHGRVADVRSKHVGDFTKWEQERAYQEAFRQLLRALDPKTKLGLSDLGPIPIRKPRRTRKASRPGA